MIHERICRDYIKQGYQWIEREELELEEVQADLKMQAVRDMDKIVLLLDERYYYDEDMKGDLFYEKKMKDFFHRLNIKGNITLQCNEKV